jgi:hypothetical protein
MKSALKTTDVVVLTVLFCGRDSARVSRGCLVRNSAGYIERLHEDLAGGSC